MDISGKHRNILFPAITLSVIAVGVFFRFYRLGLQELWYDELFSTVSALEPSLETLFSDWLKGDGNPPAYNILLWSWLKLFPATEAVVRLPSAITASLTLIIFFAWGKKFLSRNAVCIGAILFAFSYGALYYSQEARGYSFLMLLAAVSTFLCLELCRRFSNKSQFQRYAVVYFISLLLMSYTHYFGILYGVMLTCVLFMVSFFQQRNIVPLCMGCFGWFIAYLPALPNLLLLLGIDNSYWPVYGMDVVPSYFGQLLFTNHPVSKGITAILILALVITVVIRLSQHMRFHGLNAFFPMEKNILYYLFAFSLVALLLLPVMIRGIDYRHFLVFFPLHFMVFGRILSGFPLKKMVNGRVYLVLILSVLAFGFQLRGHYQVHKQQWGSSAKYVLNNYHPHAAIVVLGVQPEQSAVDYLRQGQVFEYFYMRNPEFYNYYFHRFNTGPNPVDFKVLRPNKPAFEEYVQALQKTQKNELFILGGHHLKLDHAAKDFLDEQAIDKGRKTFYSTVVYWYRF